MSAYSFHSPNSGKPCILICRLRRHWFAYDEHARLIGRRASWTEALAMLDARGYYVARRHSRFWATILDKLSGHMPQTPQRRLTAAPGE